MSNNLRGTTAPLPAAEVARSYAPFADARMLPPGAYLDQEVFDWEQANVFGGWTCVGSAADLPDVGSQRSVETGAGGILLVRGEGGTLRAFANACRHRSHELVPCGTTQTRRSIVCPYHSWSYKLDGSLRNAPGG
ncbi:MAG: Rieske 2Fe-2S domain-containing protein, partial [Candidatus Nanopelagicales bacterium]